MSFKMNQSKINRREILMKTVNAVGAIAAYASVSALSSGAFAQQQNPGDKPNVPAPLAEEPVVCEPTIYKIHIEIIKNHGHEVSISYEDVIQDKVQSLQIQGKSGHAHVVNFTEEALKALRVHGEIEIESTKEANHLHVIKITRDIIP